MTFKERVKPQLNKDFKVIEVYGDGTDGRNEIARVKLADGTEIVTKVMMGSKIYHQRRKALTEAVVYLLDSGLGGDRVAPDLYTELFVMTPIYAETWGEDNLEGHYRVCQVVREYVPGQPGDEWRAELYGELRNIQEADKECRAVIKRHPDAERISLLDFIMITQDRSARNWITDHGHRFYAIDNGMAWFHIYPDDDNWRIGCAIDNVILQKKPWRFIAGVFTTSWAGRRLSFDLHDRLDAFDEKQFLDGIRQEAIGLGFPPGLSEDWRFEGILRRLRWIKEKGRQPTASEYRNWYKKSKLMTPPEIIASGGKTVWSLQMDYDFEEQQEV